MKCPNCESTDIITITYGTPPLTGARLAKAIEEKAIVLGGCTVCEAETPAYYCRSCEHRFDPPKLDSVNKTLYIPLYGKALVSRRGLFLRDEKAETIWAAEGFPLKGKSKSKWLAYYMGMRAAVFDRWVQEQIARSPDAVILHIGCGMDSRCIRVAEKETTWFDIDFPDVIAERKRYFEESDSYHMIGTDVRDAGWLSRISGGNRAIIVMEGVSMYLQPEALQGLLTALRGHFSEAKNLMDCYSTFAARVSKYKNPINDVGVTEVYGIDDPAALVIGTGFRFTGEKDMTPDHMILQLPGMEQAVFRKLYASRTARKLYHLYKFESL